MRADLRVVPATLLAASLLGAPLVSACDGCGAGSSATVPSASPSVSASTSIAVSASAPASAPLPSSMRPPCRVLGPTPPGTPAAGDDFKWLEVAPAMRITAKDPRSARETGFEGPARVRICVEGDEESWIALSRAVDAGSALAAFTSVRGAGEAPGAEEWVVTPLGVVRYSAAAVKVVVQATRGTIELTSGTIDVWPADDVALEARRAGDAGARVDAGAPRKEEGWQRFDGAVGATLVAKASTATSGAASAALERCRAAAAKARSLAVAVGAPDAALATLAAEHVIARKLARAACGIARVRASALEPDAASAALAKDAAAADAVWRKLD